MSFTPDDREPHQLELSSTPWPVAPLDVFLTSGYMPGVFDLTWDDPKQQALNTPWDLLGVNLYRSFDSEYGPYERLNEEPLGSTFYRDQTDNVLVVEEDVSDRFLMRGSSGTDIGGPRYVFKTSLFPIVRPGSQNEPSYHPNDVVVRVNGQLVPVLKVNGPAGEVELDPSLPVDVNLQKYSAVPMAVAGTKVTASYRYNRSFLRTSLAQRVFYRVTCVGLDTQGKIAETPLERAAFTSSYEIEKLDYIWREAVRRNRWILSEGGERVKVFVRKQAGQVCSCFQYNHQQPLNDCLKCFGTGFLGGYDGPWDIVMAPDDAERSIERTESGTVVRHSYEVWTGPTPLLSQRDFIVKLNGERYSVGPVRMPTNRGMVLQQHFNIGRIDERDVRYKVMVGAVPSGREYATLSVPESMDPGGPMTSHTRIPDERELRGRTTTWKNIMY